MKNLDRTKAYDLRDLNDEQRKEFYLSTKKHFNVNVRLKDFKDLEGWCVRYDNHQGVYYFSTDTKTTTNALTLFEPTLKIGDAFEYNGYICEVKSEVERWVYDTYIESYYRTSQRKGHLKEITNQTLIKLLEENAIH